MTIQGQRVLGAEDGRAEEGQERAGVEKPPQRIEPLGFTWAETPSILKTLQPPLVERHATALVAAQAPCDHGGKALGIQASHPRTVRPLLGTRTLTSPRLSAGRGQRRQTITGRPWSALLTDAVAPERRVRATTGAARVSSGRTAPALQDVRPGEATRKATPIQTQARAVAPGGEDARGEEPGAGVEGGPADGETRPLPAGPLTVGLDGGYGRDGDEQKRPVEGLGGKSLRAFRRAAAEAISAGTCVGVVQTLETNPQRRLVEGLHSPGQPMNQPRTCLSAGGDPGRPRQRDLSPPAEPRREWCPLAMRLTVRQQPATGRPRPLQDAEERDTLRDPVVRAREHLTGSLGPGPVDQAVQKITALAMDLEGAVATTDEGTGRKRRKAGEAFPPALDRHRAGIPHDGARSRSGERLSPGLVESTVTQGLSQRVGQKQPRHGTNRGAQLLWQAGPLVANG